MRPALGCAAQSDLVQSRRKPSRSGLRILVFAPVLIDLVLIDKAKRRHRPFVFVYLLIVQRSLDLGSYIFEFLVVGRIGRVSFFLRLDGKCHDLLQAVELFLLQIRVLGEPFYPHRVFFRDIGQQQLDLVFTDAVIAFRAPANLLFPNYQPGADSQDHSH